VTHIVVREHALLTTAATARNLDAASVSATAFDYLRRLSASFRKSGAALVQVESGIALRLDNYVGIIETPCGTVIEVLPKHLPGAGAEQEARALLIRMLSVVLDVPAREAGEADIQLMRRPLTEWLMHRFVMALERLLKRGLRADYLRVDAEERFLRGQLTIPLQLRQPPGRQDRFRIRHDVYSFDRAENRLLKLAVARVRARTREAATWRTACELETLLVDVPASRDVAADFGAWSSDRLMAHYADTRRWCELVLGIHMPVAQSGAHRGMSLLFPMERLFEDYVARMLAKQLATGVSIRRQASSEYLCRHDKGQIFQLKPDIVLAGPESVRWVLDTKWKLIDASDRPGKYGLSQSDFYQLHAYGHSYLGGGGEMFLVYPLTHKFSRELPTFHFSDRLRLRVVPFDLDAGTLAGVDTSFIRATKSASAPQERVTPAE
jgi:5-methylcytosine-specific restriction enzyme subunit McrC